MTGGTRSAEEREAMTDLEKRLIWIEAMADESRGGEKEKPQYAMVMALCEIARQLARIADHMKRHEDRPPWEPEAGRFPLVDEEKKKGR